MFFYIFLILLAVWIVPKMVRGYLFVHRLKKQARNMYEQMYNGTGQAASDRRQTRRPGWSAATPRRKKIDPSVGEYVKFQEITVTGSETPQAESADKRDTPYTVEQQITDVTWEDIK